jgi:hypothetical protein
MSIRNCESPDRLIRVAYGCGPWARYEATHPLDQFAEGANFIATTLVDEYCARLVETWLGVPAGDFLSGSPEPSSWKPHSQLGTRGETAQNQGAATSALT